MIHIQVIRKGVFEMMVDPEWLDYAIFSDDGRLIGISEDAPDSAKEEYEEYLQLIKNGVKP